MCLLSQIAPCNPGTDCAITLHIAAIQVPPVICADWRGIVGHPLNEDLTSAIRLCAADDVLMAQYPHRCDLQDVTAMLILFAVVAEEQRPVACGWNGLLPICGVLRKNVPGRLLVISSNQNSIR